MSRKETHMKLVSRLWLPLACGLMLGTSLTLLKSQSAAPPPAASAAAPASKQSDEEWIRGGEDEKFRLVSKHLRGLDVAMIETGYRYTELYWAGQDRNWEFAAYQLDKIRHTIVSGWIYVFDHPHFAVTDEHGRFRIRGVPPGRYKLIVRQPDIRYGSEREVTVSVEQAVKLEIKIQESHSTER